MNNRRPLQRWDSVVSFLEDVVETTADNDLLGEPEAMERASALRNRIQAIVGGASAGARRELLRRVLARRRATAVGESIAFVEPDELSDSEVEGLLRDLLREGDADE